MSEKTGNILRAALFLIALAFVAAGVSRGEMSTVLRKAVTVCLECIGIG
ncbi:MAG: thioredoxin [Synergistaceae bacterium]|jgi:hypothetical protein|nr:thioredoxin [Synergistaceae bacterium]